MNSGFLSWRLKIPSKTSFVEAFFKAFFLDWSWSVQENQWEFLKKIFTFFQCLVSSFHFFKSTRRLFWNFTSKYTFKKDYSKLNMFVNKLLKEILFLSFIVVRVVKIFKMWYFIIFYGKTMIYLKCSTWKYFLKKSLVTLCFNLYKNSCFIYSVEAKGNWVCTFTYTWFDFRTWKTVIGGSRKIWFPCPKSSQFVPIPSEICWISKIFRTCQVSTHFKGNFMLTKNVIRNLCSKSKIKTLQPILVIRGI